MEKTKKEKNPCKVVTGLVRFSYAHVFEPASFGDNDDKKFSCAILIPKKDKKTIAALEAGIEAAKEVGKIKKAFTSPLHDGDDERPDDEAYEDMYYLNAKSTRRPYVVDEDLNPIIDPEEFYSGCWGQASVTFFSYDYAGKKGVGVALNGVKKTKDGEKLSGGSTAEEDFGDDDLS